jgi:hypothetical protein
MNVAVHSAEQVVHRAAAIAVKLDPQRRRRDLALDPVARLLEWQRLADAGAARFDRSNGFANSRVLVPAMSTGEWSR